MPLILCLVLLTNGCVKTQVVEHTLTITKVPVKVEAPIEPEYEKLDINEHIGSKKNVTIMWNNFKEAEIARKSAYDAYKAYDVQVTKEDEN